VEVKRLRAKLRKVYNKRKLEELYKFELKRIPQNLLEINKLHRNNFCDQYNNIKTTAEFYRYVKMRKGSREIFPAIKDK